MAAVVVADKSCAVMQEAVGNLFTVGVSDGEHGAAACSPVELAAGRLRLCLTFLSHAAAMPASLRQCVSTHGLPAVFSIACNAAYPVVVSSSAFRHQLKTDVLSFISVCSARCAGLKAAAQLVCVNVSLASIRHCDLLRCQQEYRGCRIGDLLASMPAVPGEACHRVAPSVHTARR